MKVVGSPAEDVIFISVVELQVNLRLENGELIRILAEDIISATVPDYKKFPTREKTRTRINMVRL